MFQSGQKTLIIEINGNVTLVHADQVRFQQDSVEEIYSKPEINEDDRDMPWHGKQDIEIESYIDSEDEKSLVEQTYGNRKTYPKNLVAQKAQRRILGKISE